MKFSWKPGLALVIGGMVLGTVGSGLAASTSRTAGTNPQSPAQMNGPGLRGPFGKVGLIHSDALVEGDTAGTTKNIRTDNGTIKAINGNSLTIDEKDGSSVDVPIQESTMIRRDRSDAKPADLQLGDHVTTVREKPSNANESTIVVVAISAARYQQMEQQRAACDKDPTQCRGPRGGMFPGGPPPANSDGAPMGAPTTTNSSVQG